MKSKKPKGINITIRPESHQFLSDMAVENHLSIVELMELAVEYLKKSGFDPKDKDLKSPAEEIKRFRNTFISFMRTHEKEVLSPLVNRTEVAVNTLIEFLKFRPDGSPIPPQTITKDGFKIPLGNIKK